MQVFLIKNYIYVASASADYAVSLIKDIVMRSGLVANEDLPVNMASLFDIEGCTFLRCLLNY